MRRIRTEYLIAGAGLTGAGIEQAVLSACLLAQSLLKGQSYTENMRPQTEYIADSASDVRKKQFRKCFFIMRKGEPALPY